MEINFNIKFSYNINSRDVKKIKEHIIDFIVENRDEEYSNKTIEDISDKFIKDNIIKFLKECDSSEIFYLDGIEFDTYFNTINFDFAGDCATDFICFCADELMNGKK